MTTDFTPDSLAVDLATFFITRASHLYYDDIAPQSAKPMAEIAIRGLVTGDHDSLQMGQHLYGIAQDLAAYASVKMEHLLDTSQGKLHRWQPADNPLSQEAR